MRFCDLDARGEQLSPGGWARLAALFIMPGAPRLDEITVVRDFVVSKEALDNGRAQLFVEYVELGRIDPSNARFFTVPSINVRKNFDVVKTSGTTSGGSSGRADGFAGWRIAGPVPKPHLTVGAAIRYGTELRANAKDLAMRNNADKLLAALKRLRESPR